MSSLVISAAPSRSLEERPGGFVSTVAFSADGAHIVVGNEKGYVYSWDAQTGEEVGQNRAHMNAIVMAMATYPRAPFAVHASEHGIKFHLIGAHLRVPTFEPKHMKTVLSLDFSRDGDHMASADRGGETIIWDLWSGEPYRRFKPGDQAVYSLRYHPDGNRLATASGDGKVRVWDVRENKMLYEVDADPNGCLTTGFSPDGKWLASGGKDRKVKVWDAANGNPVAELEGHGDVVNIVIFHPGGEPFLISASDDKTVRVWNLAEKAVIQTLDHPEPVYALAWRPDGKVIATGAGNQVRLFDVN